jgi:lysophospholipase L1-like esterase
MMHCCSDDVVVAIRHLVVVVLVSLGVIYVSAPLAITQMTLEPEITPEIDLAPGTTDIHSYYPKDYPALLRLSHNRLNQIQAPNLALLTQLRETLEGAKVQRQNIIYFGDSHVQIGIAQQLMRDYFQSRYGNAGRGMVFPYSLAKTYSQIDFTSEFLGSWRHASGIQIYPKIPLGISGFVGQSEDAKSSFTIQFKKDLPVINNHIRLFYKTASPNFKVHITTDVGRIVESFLVASQAGESNILDLYDTPVSKELKIELINGADDGESIFIYGVELDSANPGLVIHNLGVGGAAFISLKNQIVQTDELKALSPRLTIIDLGTNDIIYRNSIDSNLTDTVLEIISTIRRETPDNLILIIPPQDMTFRGRPITVAAGLRDALKAIAFDNNCLFYDWYSIAGGKGVMSMWFSYGLAQRDHIHLTSLGYALKGYMLSKAIDNTIYNSFEDPMPAVHSNKSSAPKFMTVRDFLKSSSLPFVKDKVSTRRRRLKRK